MKLRKKLQTVQDSSVGFDVSSMIDVCFLLLIYFIVTSTIMPREGDLGLEGSGEPPVVTQVRLEPIHVGIDAAGVIYSGEGVARQQLDADPAVRDLPLLRGMLELCKEVATASDEKPVVVISVEAASTQQRVIDVLNTLAGVEISQVVFADNASDDE